MLIAPIEFVHAEEEGPAVNTLILSKLEPVDSLCNRLSEVEVVQFRIEAIKREHVAKRIVHFKGSSSGLTGAVAFMVFCLGSYYWVVK